MAPGRELAVNSSSAPGVSQFGIARKLASFTAIVNSRQGEEWIAEASHGLGRRPAIN